MKGNVIGQTGRSGILLSDDAVNRKVSQGRTARYQYQKVQSGWIAWICGPFHSRTYGTCGFGTKKSNAKAALQRNLADNYGYLGTMMFSDVDGADFVGGVDRRLAYQRTLA